MANPAISEPIHGPSTASASATADLPEAVGPTRKMGEAEFTEF